MSTFLLASESLLVMEIIWGGQKTDQFGLVPNQTELIEFFNNYNPNQTQPNVRFSVQFSDHFDFSILNHKFLCIFFFWFLVFFFHINGQFFTNFYKRFNFVAGNGSLPIVRNNHLHPLFQKGI